MTYILVLTLWANAVTTQEFDTRKACELAATSIADEYTGAKARCYPKGTPLRETP